MTLLGRCFYCGCWAILVRALRGTRLVYVCSDCGGNK